MRRPGPGWPARPPAKSGQVLCVKVGLQCAAKEVGVV